ncbi:MAG TPA: serine O-acetyltransferase [Pirellulaceae bacterium]|mgnify:CR=1 FL=1|nr:serine O-acetyltransferase [Pirellulaceae bacterium]
MVASKTLDTDELRDVIEQLAACGDAVPVASAPSAPIPKRSRIGETLDLYRTLLFPSVADDRDAVLDGGWQLRRACELREMLANEFAWALQQPSPCGEPAGSPPCPDDLAAQTLRRLPEMKRMLLDDAQAALAGDPACTGIDEVLICYPGFLAISVHRLAHEIYGMGVRILARMMSEWVHSRTGIDIHPGAQIGRHFFIDHGTGVVIGETCVVGDHVRIYQGVTLGALSFARDDSGNLIRDTKRHPTIENHVVIYANATVLGGRTLVGHHSIIGASVWLAQSIAPFTTVVMEQPKLRFRNQSPTAFDQPPDYQI